jgi:hypothetical protein
MMLFEVVHGQHGCLVKAVCLNSDRVAKPFEVKVRNKAASRRTELVAKASISVDSLTIPPLNICASSL